MIVSKANLLLLCFSSGDSELLLWDDENRELCKLSTDKTDEHEDKITCCDTLLCKGMIVTGDKDGLVKIWNSKKQLIREIKFVGKINSVAFLNQDGDIIVGHAGNLSRLEYTKYKDTRDKSKPDVEIGKSEKDMLVEKIRKYSGPEVKEADF